MSGELPFTGFVIPGGGGGVSGLTSATDITSNALISGDGTTGIKGAATGSNELYFNNSFHGGEFYSYVDNGTNSIEVEQRADTPSFQVNVDGDSGQIGLSVSGVNASVTLSALGSGSYVTATPGLRVGDGSNSAPSHSFINSTDMGIYRVSAASMGVAVGGIALMQFTTSGFLMGTHLVGDGFENITGFKSTVEASTAGSGAPNILTVAESLTALTNEGTTAENYHTLPSAAAGLVFTFVVQDADGIRITANTGDTIRPIAGTAASASGGFIRCATQGAFITLLAINATEWIAIGSAGTWTIDV